MKSEAQKQYHAGLQRARDGLKPQAGRSSSWYKRGYDSVKPKKVELKLALADETRNGRGNHVLQIGEEEKRFYLDKQNNLLTCWIDKLGDGEVITYFHDYSNHEGVQLPEAITGEFRYGPIADPDGVAEPVVTKIRFKNIAINVDVDNSIFEKP